MDDIDNFEAPRGSYTSEEIDRVKGDSPPLSRSRSANSDEDYLSDQEEVGALKLIIARGL